MNFPSIFEFSTTNALFLESFQVPSFFENNFLLNNSYSSITNFFGDFFLTNFSNLNFLSNGFTFTSFFLDSFLVFNFIFDDFQFHNVFNFKNLLLNIDSSNFFPLTSYTDSTVLEFFDEFDLYTQSIVTYIDKIDEMSIFQNLENITSTYHYSVPNVKLAYPEPFIASPSFIHSDL
jgi:hypothetical protein